ncbi:hypothetical protein H5T87_05205 [bacterium]|nr:hypothetical protein [bacterium]
MSEYYENIVSRFFVPREGDKIALIIIAVLIIFIISILLGIYLFFRLPPNFPLSLLILILLLFAGLSSLAVALLIDKLKIGSWLLLTENEIRLGNKRMPWKNVKQIIYHPNPPSAVSAFTPNYLPRGVYLLTFSPLEFREKIKELSDKPLRVFAFIRSNSFLIPFEVEKLPELLNQIFRFVPSVIFDVETLLISQLSRGESLIGNSSELFQAEIYNGKSSVPSLHNFYQGIRLLLNLSLPLSEKHLKKAYDEGEPRARPYLALSLFLQQKYEQCLSILGINSYPLNRGEKIILLASMVNTGKWNEILGKTTSQHMDVFESSFKLGALCFLQWWDELISEGEKIGHNNLKPALEVCLECARNLRLKAIPTSSYQTSFYKTTFTSTLRYYIMTLLGILGAMATSFIKGWFKGIGYLIAFILMMLLEWLFGKYSLKEYYAQWSSYLQKKLASPFWCSLLYLSQTTKT